jgi:hypothetical protein
MNVTTSRSDSQNDVVTCVMWFQQGGLEYNPSLLARPSFGFHTVDIPYAPLHPGLPSAHLPHRLMVRAAIAVQHQ